MPTDVLVSAWGLDAADLAHALAPRIGSARLFFAGRLADDLGRVQGPLELVALTGGGGDVSTHTFDAGGGGTCPVRLELTVLPMGVVRSWSVPLVRLLTDPGCIPPPMPRPVVAGMHALYTQRDLVPGNRYLSEELEEAHVEVLPLYTATRELYRLRRMAGGSAVAGAADPAEQLAALVRALLGAWGYCNPCPSTLLPLFERAAHRLRLAPAVPAAVRRAVTDRTDTASLRSALLSLERLRAADPVLRFCAGLVDGASARPVAAAPAGAHCGAQLRCDDRIGGGDAVQRAPDGLPDGDAGPLLGVGEVADAAT